MKTCFLSFFLGIGACFANGTYSQETFFTVEYTNQSVKEIIHSIERKSEYIFFYLDNSLDLSRKVSLKVENQRVEAILDQLVAGTNNRYHISDRQIIISKEDGMPLPDVQQQRGRTITGLVKDDTGPIIGANIIVKGTSNGNITDYEGKFILENVPADAILQISYIGYLTQEIKLTNQTQVTVILREDSEALEEVVVIGYGTLKKKDLTGAVSQMSASSMRDLKVSHPTQALAGQLAGVQVQQSAGAPGDAAVIRVRGAGSISASNAPLYVVDGYPLGEQNLNSINPSDIESIEVLKDASASAIYGSRAANGVVLVTTKSGKSGKIVVNLDLYYGFQNVTKKLDLMDAQEFAAMSKEAFNTNYTERTGNPASDPLDVRPSGNRYRYPAIYDDAAAMAAIGAGTDWQDEIFRTAPVQNYQLSVSGGSERTKYMFSTGYFSQDGIIIGSDYERFSARAKIDSELTQWLKVGVNLAPTYIGENTIQAGHWASNGVVLAAGATSSIVPVRHEDGTWASQAEYAVASDGLTGVTNAVANALDVDRSKNTLRLFGNMYAEISLLKNLKFKTTFGADIMQWRSKYFYPSNVPANGTVAPLPSTARSGNTENREVLNWLNENTLTYAASFGLHEIDAVAGFTAQKNVYNQSKVEASDFPDDIIRTMNNGKVKTGTSDMNEWSLLSYLARVNYRFNNKYYLTASIRTDGSSRFGKNNRYGYFPSGSVAWRLSQEEFMQDIDWLSDLKVRGSFGLTGNNSIPNYGAIGTMENKNYVFGSGTGSVVTGLAQKSFSNNDLTWEKTQQFDFGLELALFNSRLSFIFDLYSRNTTDLLLEVDIPTITGFSRAWRNIGKVNNKGFEFSVNTVNVQSKDFLWNTNLNLSANRNKVLALGPSGDPIQSDGGAGTTHITMIGEVMGSFYGYKQIGVYMNQADLENSPHLADSHVGDVKYADVDGNGTIDANDRTLIGNNEPAFTWGMTNQIVYKNLDLSFVLQGVHGRDVLHLAKRFYENLEGNQNQMRTTLNRWHSPDDPGDGWMPRANAQTTGQNNAISTRWIEDASFVRMNNVTLGYTLPQALAQKCTMQNARIYFSIQNPLTFTAYSGYNPETSFREDDNSLARGADYGVYPLNRTFTLGVNVTF